MNLLANGSLDEGQEHPANWEWVVISGRPMWRFDYSVKTTGLRSIQILQDVGSVHGEFRQRVACVGGKRYRLRGRIKTGNEGTGEESGANLCVKSMAGERLLHAMLIRPFFLGHADWSLWSLDYRAPEEADALVVSFDMRKSDGVAWFDDIELVEAEAPVCSSELPGRLTEAGRIVACPQRDSVCVTGGTSADVTAGIARELVGDVERAKSASDALGSVDCDAIIITSEDDDTVTLGEIEEAAQRRLVVMPLGMLERLLGRGGVRTRVVEGEPSDIAARIEMEDAVTRGFARGDIFAWGVARDLSGLMRQEQICDEDGVLAGLGFETVAGGISREAGAGGAVILWKACGGGAILALDTEMAGAEQRLGNDGNLPWLLLSNALGRPQTFVGKYVTPQFEYGRYLEFLETLTAGCKGISLEEEGKSGEGRPIYSLTVGREGAPTFYVDCGMHPDEWGPCYGVPLYMARLAAEYEHGLPWARALLDKLKVKCVPLVAPDGWERNNRAPRGVNLNRNFPNYWEECRDSDKGSGPLSEPETRIIERILRGGNVVAAVNWHETSANTNWIGYPRAGGRYHKYCTPAPAVIAQAMDGRHFYNQPALWTQLWDLRNNRYHHTDSYPYLRDYSTSKSPFAMNFADSLGIDGIIVEQYGNSEFGFTASPQRMDMTGFIMEMLLGIQIGLVCRNGWWTEKRFSIPLSAAGGCGEVVVYAPSGDEVRRAPLKDINGMAHAEADVEPGGVMVVEIDPAPWRNR